MLIKNDKILSDNKIVAKTLNNHFVNITESLNKARPLSDNVQQTSDEKTASSLLDQLKCFEKTTLVFQKTLDQFPKFNFENVNSEDVREIIYNLEEDKSTGADNIPLKVLKMAIGVVCGPLAAIFNLSLSGKTFPFL